MNVFFIIALAILGAKINIDGIFWVLYILGVFCWIVNLIIKATK